MVARDVPTHVVRPFESCRESPGSELFLGDGRVACRKELRASSAGPACRAQSSRTVLWCAVTGVTSKGPELELSDKTVVSVVSALCPLSRTGTPCAGLFASERITRAEVASRAASTCHRRHRARVTPPEAHVDRRGEGSPTAGLRRRSDPDLKGGLWCPRRLASLPAVLARPRRLAASKLRQWGSGLVKSSRLPEPSESL